MFLLTCPCFQPQRSEAKYPQQKPQSLNRFLFPLENSDRQVQHATTHTGLLYTYCKYDNVINKYTYTRKLSYYLSVYHRPTDGLVEAFSDWAAGQREDTEMEKYMPKQFPRQPALHSQSTVLTCYNEVWIRDALGPSLGTVMHSLFSMTSHLAGLLLTGSSG